MLRRPTPTPAYLHPVLIPGELYLCRHEEGNTVPVEIVMSLTAANDERTLVTYGDGSTAWVDRVDLDDEPFTGDLPNDLMP